MITTSAGDILKFNEVERWEIHSSGVLTIISKGGESIFHYSPYFWRYFSVMEVGDEMEEEIEEDDSSAGGSTRV